MPRRPQRGLGCWGRRGPADLQRGYRSVGPEKLAQFPGVLDHLFAREGLEAIDRKSRYTRAIMIPNTDKFVAYFRVSTGKQGKSGLGIEAQREATSTAATGRSSTNTPRSSPASGPIGPPWRKRWPLRGFTAPRWSSQQGRSLDALCGLPIASAGSRRRCPIR
jgi:hypothetical protein